MNQIIWTYPLNWDTFSTGKTMFVIDHQAKQLQQVYPRNEFISLTFMWELNYLFDYEKEKHIISVNEFDVEIKTLVDEIWKDED